MKKYFIGLEWIDENNSLLHLKDFETGANEFVYIPTKFNLEKINKKICIGTLNPYTREYIGCNNFVEENQVQCNRCKYLFDFYKCVRCHGEDCFVKNDDVLKYCNTPHYVYLAYFANNRIKVGTASKVKKYNRLLEQGALFSIFIAKTPTGKIARQIEKIVIDNGIVGAVTTIYKMKNISYNENSFSVKKILIEKYKEILNFIGDDKCQYLIEPEFNSFDDIKNNIDKNMLFENTQISLFNLELQQNRQYVIKKSFESIYGKYLFAVGKILALENNGIVELIDTKKIEGCLFDFKNIKSFNFYQESKCLRVK